jgi:hypothetical protein
MRGNDEARVPRLRAATTRQANAERMKDNDEARMTNAEGMTKSEDRNARAEDSFWDEGAESIVRDEPETKRDYDLEERTARFGEAVIDFARTIPQNAVTNRIVNQLVGAGTSVGANYVEAMTRFRRGSF